MSDLSAAQVVKRAQDLLIAGRDDENLALLEVAVEQFPNHPEIRLLYGTALLPFRPHESGEELRKAVALDPDDPARLTKAATILFELGEIDSARMCTVHAARLAGPEFVFVTDLANVAGKLLAIDGDLEPAEEALRAAVEGEPDQEAFARDLALFLADQGRADEGLAVIEEALRVVTDPQKLLKLREQLRVR